MASNDTNLWDEDPDELLRKDWQQAFADFKVPSRPSLRQHILSQVTAQSRPKPMDWLAGGVLLLLISTVLFYAIRTSNRLASLQGHIAHVQPASPSDSRRVITRQWATPDGLATPSEQVEAATQVDRPVTSQPIPDRQSTASSVETATTNGSLGHSQQLPNRNRLRLHATLKQSLVEAYRTARPFAKSTFPSDTDILVTLPPFSNASYREQAEALAKSTAAKTGNFTSTPHVVLSATPASPIVLARLNVLSLSTLPSSFRALPDQLPTNKLVTHPADTVNNRVRRISQWFVETVPLSSFQWMSASSMSTVHLTQVKAPAAFSPATWGYQINGGLRWQRWQAYLSVGQLRRWAYYTVNENRFRMDIGPANSFQPVQEKHVVVENVALPMVGGGLSQYRFLEQGRYTVELGSQVMYSLMDGQTLASLRGGAARRLPLSRRLELRAGLLVEYGLTRLMSEQHQLTIHPLVVGINIRLQPRLFPPER